MKIIGCILGASIFLSWLMLATKPESARRVAQISSPLVNTSFAEKGNAQIQLDALGTIQASQSTSIRSRVVGQVEQIGKNGDVGSVAKKGELLIQIEDDTYKNAFSIKKSMLAQAKAAYDLEIGEQKVARAEIEQLKKLSQNLARSQQGKHTSPNGTPYSGNAILGMTNMEMLSGGNASNLALRAPQLAQAKAAVDLAQAELSTAQLNMDYTSIKAPYNALVVKRNTSLGSQANTSDVLLEIVGTDEYRVEAAVALDKIAALDLEDVNNSKVNIKSGAGVERQGFIVRRIASLDDSTRMGRVLIRIPDPLGLKNKEAALILGDHVTVELNVGTLKDVVVLPRSALHSGDVVWVAVPLGTDTDNPANISKDTPEATLAEQETKTPDEVIKRQNPQEKSKYTLDIRYVTTSWKDTRFVYVSEGIAEGERIIISTLPAPIQGMPIRINEK